MFPETPEFPEIPGLPDCPDSPETGRLLSVEGGESPLSKA